jgi:ABC-type branched-subunit amino acid transport system substrate-binding protein
MRGKSLAIAVAAAMLALSSVCGAQQPPIRFMVIAGTGPGTTGSDIVPGATAAVEAINARGGVKGRKLEMEHCDPKNDPNRAGACARKAASDETIVATVGNALNSGGGEQVNPILEKANMAAIATKAYVPYDWISPSVFTVDLGAASGAAGSTVILTSKGIKNFTIVSLQVPAVVTMLDFVDKLVMPNYPQAKVDKRVLMPPATTDVTPYVAETLRGDPEAVLVIVTRGLAIPFVKALRAQGFKGPIATGATVVAQEDLTGALKGYTDGLVLAGGFSRTGKGWDDFSAAMAKYQPDVQYTEQAVVSWIGVNQLASVANRIDGPITREKVLKAMNELKNYSTDGLTPNLDYTMPPTVPGYTRAFNPTAVEDRIEGDKIVTPKPVTFVNALTGKKIVQQ